MQTTISLKIDTSLVNQVKKAAKIRGVSMSDYIRDRLKFGFSSSKNKTENLSMFKYFGVNQPDEQTEYFEKRLEERKSEYDLKNENN